MSRRKNNFTKAMSHLKSNRIDEKINQLEEQPTNNTYGLMTVGDPSHTVQPPDIEVTELDFDKGLDDDDGRDTSGIFNEEGEILTIEPNVGDTSYILGPMASMWYAWGNFSTFGYIREADRKMVNLGTIVGKLSDWDQNQFNSYGQMTLEQAVWFYNTPKKGNSGNDPANANYRAFYPGPPSNNPDQFGRYRCTITGTPKEFEKTPPPYVTNPTQGPESASDQFSGMLNQIMDKQAKGEKLSKAEEEWLRAQGLDDWLNKDTKDVISDLLDMGVAAAAAKALAAAWGALSGPIGNALQSEWANRTISDAAYANFLKTGQMPPGLQGWQPFKAFTPQMLATGPTAGASAAISAAISTLLGGSTQQSTPQDSEGMKTGALIPPTENAFKEFGNNLSSSIENALKTAGEYLFQPQSEIDGKRGQGNKLIQGNQNRNQGVTSPGRYNLSLAVELVNSIVTGQPRQIPIAPKAAIDMGNSMNPEALSQVLTLDTTTPMDAENTINPKGKSDQVLSGTGWGVQGGSTFNFNTKTNKLEVVSNKTLRTTSGGESVERDPRSGLPTRFTDIPDANPQTVERYTEKLLNNKAVDTFLGGLANGVKVVSLNNGGQGYKFGDKTYNNAWDMMKDNKSLGYDSMVKDLSKVATGIAEGGVQGTASNAIAFRKALQNLEIKSSTDSKGWKPFANNSDVENIGGAYGQVGSKAEIPFNKLPPKIQQVILSKTGKNKSVKESVMVLTEAKRRILREIKKPYKVPKTPTKFKGIKPRVRVTGKGLMEVPEIPKQFKPEPTIWRKSNYDKNVKASQEKKNEVLEYVGAAADHWEYLTETRRKEKNAKRDAFYSTKKDRDFLYDYWYGGKKHKVTRKEDIDNDCLVYIEDEDGKKFSMLQSKLNEMLEEEKIKDMFDSYIPEEEQGEREKNFDKVTRLKSIVGKIKRGDIGPEYPNEPPPELVNGWHPKLGKKYKHDKLDPQSAEAMPDTGDPEIDANIKKATDSKSKARKLKNLLGKKA